MSLTLMAEVWPLDMSPTDKVVLLALADSANDEDCRCWIAVKSRTLLNRRGKPKLDLIRKTSLSERTVQASIKRLVEAGHITREEKPGVGCDYWVHPAAPTPAADAGPQEPHPAGDSPTPAANAGEPRSSCGETLKNHKQPNAGARARASREDRPPAGPLGGPATGDPPKVVSVVERDAEGERERKVRDAVLVDAKAAPRWFERCGLKCAPILTDDGPFGLEVFCAPGDRSAVERVQARLEHVATEAVGVQCRWVSIREGTVRA